MAKFFLTNNADYYSALKNNHANTGLRGSFEYSSERIHALAVHKQDMQNVNAAQTDNDFCIATGTCIYKESLNYRRLLEEYNGQTADIRRDCIGQYAIAIKKGQEVTIFGDWCGCYDIYYWHNNGEYIVSSSLYDIAVVLGGKITINETVLVERSMQRAVLNGDSLFHEIHRLRSGEQIDINLHDKRLDIRFTPVDYPLSDAADFDSVVKVVAQILKKNVTGAVKALGAPTICITGGLDSRLILATYLGAGIKPKLFYGRGHMHGYSQDEDIARMYAERYGLELTIGNFSTPAVVDEEWNRLIPRFGFTTAGMWGGFKTTIHSFTTIPNAFINVGWGGEAYRDKTYGWFDTKSDDNHCTVEEYFYNSYNHSSTHIVSDNKAEHEARIIEKLRKECSRLHIDADNLTIDDTILLDLCYQSMADTQVPAFMQQVKYCWMPLFEYDALRNRLPYQLKSDAKFQLSLIKEIFSDILEMPIFSAAKWWKLNTENMTLEKIPAAQTYREPVVRQALHRIIPYPVIRFAKRILRIDERTPEQKRLGFDVPIDTLPNQQYKLEFLRNNASVEDSLIYAILIRALKSLGY